MIRGAEKHIIVVKNPDKRYFEQAIFILKNDAFRKTGRTEQEIMAEAKAAAEDYVKSNLGKYEKLGYLRP